MPEGYKRLEIEQDSNGKQVLGVGTELDPHFLSCNAGLSLSLIHIWFDSRYNSTLQQLEIGRTSYGSQADDCAAAAVGVSKLHENYVGITLNIDPFQEGGEQIYDCLLYTSQNHELGHDQKRARSGGAL